VLDRTYTFSSTNNDGRITQTADAVSGETVVYQYDSLKRLTSAATTERQLLPRPSECGMRTWRKPRSGADALHQWARPKPFKPNPTVERMRKKLSSGAARSLSAKRRTIVEPVFGQIKEARRLRRFAFRGLEKVQAEWKLICLTHNLLKLFRGSWQPQAS
jgi:YD repeat-containing protein